MKEQAARTDLEHLRARIAELEAETRMLLAAVENSSSPLFLKDREGRYVLANSAAAHAFGRKGPGEVVGRFDRDLTPEPVAAAIAESDRRVIESGEAEVVEETVVSTSGAVRIFLTSKGPWHDAEGRIAGVQGSAQDITRRREAEIALREAERNSRAILESISDGFISIDRDWRLTFVNRVAGSILNEDPQNVTGRILWDVYPGLAASAFAPVYREAMETGRPGRIEALYPEHQRWYEVDAYPFAGGISLFFRDVTDRRAAQEALRERDERYARVMHATNDVIWDWDLVADTVAWNPAVRDCFGYDPDEIDPAVSWWKNHVHPEDRQRVLNEVYQVIEGGEFWRGEYRFLCADGTWAEVLDRGSVVRDASGKPVRMIGSLLDRTHEKRAERELRASEAMLSAVLDALPVGVALADAQGRILRSNAAFREMWNHPPETTHWAQYGAWVAYRPDTGKQIEAHEWAMARAILNGETTQGELLEIQPFGSTERHTVVNNAAPVRDADGRIIAGVAAAADITKTLSAEKALRESILQNRQMADALPQLVWVTGPDGHHLWFNQRWYEYTGATDEQCMGEGWSAFFHPDDWDNAWRVWRHSLETGEPYDIEYRCRRRDGVYRWFIGRALPILDQAGNIVRWFGTCTDIDDQKRVEGELRRANQDLERFAYSASHDLQEPLRNMAIFSQLLERRYAARLDRQGVEFLGYIVEGAHRMGRLVGDLLAYTRAGAGALESGLLNSVDAEQILRQVIADLRPAIEETAAAVEYERLPRVRINEFHLHQLFQNLIGNAIKYRKPGVAPAIRVSVEGMEGQWRFTVEDNGIGIAPGFHTKIFGLFTRLHGRGEHEGGTGIGLALCERIVGKYGGRIWVESEPGVGSRFHFTVPRTGGAD